VNGVISWVGFFGGWLLVAGPVYQAGIELREEAFERQLFVDAAERVEKPEPVSKWWWLFPPAHYIKSTRNQNKFRDAILMEFTPEQRAQLFSFMSKARGWMYVGLGALLIATKETWELCEHYEWSELVFAVIWIAMVSIAFGSVSYQLRRDQSVSATYASPGD
jgi:hypothetical protein